VGNPYRQRLTGPDDKFFVGAAARQFVMVGFWVGYTAFFVQPSNAEPLNDGEWLQAGAK